MTCFRLPRAVTESVIPCGPSFDAFPFFFFFGLSSSAAPSGSSAVAPSSAGGAGVVDESSPSFGLASSVDGAASGAAASVVVVATGSGAGSGPPLTALHSAGLGPNSQYSRGSVQTARHKISYAQSNKILTFAVLYDYWGRCGCLHFCHCQTASKAHV